MRIGITCYPTFGGSGVVATELGKALAQRGDHVHFISYALPSRLQVLHERLRFHEVSVTPYPLFDDFPPYTLALATKMAEVAEFEELDILHVHYAIPHAISAYLAKQILKSRLAVVTTLHGTDITLVGRDASYLPITRFGIEASDGVTAVSRSLELDTRANFHTEKAIEVIPNFVDPERFRKNGRTLFGGLVRPSEHLVCHISNFRPVKRIGDVLKIFQIIARALPSRLVMIGDGPERSKAEAFCREEGLSDQVLFLGNVANLEQILGACDVFLLPSETESFGMAALEALASEVPVIASRAGGLPEVITSEEVGSLFAVGDVEGMARRAIEILSDPELRARMGAAGREHAIANFRMDVVVQRYVDFYQRTIAAM